MADDATTSLSIAVVGSGVAGLAAAWLLSKRHHVTLYESASRAGGHSHTVDAPGADGPIAVDTGFIVYNEATYPNLTALLRHLEVETTASEMTFAVSLDGGRLEYAANTPLSFLRHPKILASRRFWSTVGEVCRFYRTGPRQMRALAAEGLDLGQFLDRCGYGEAFQRDHLLPQAAAIWSCSPDEVRGLPATAFLAFCDSHGLMRFAGRPAWRSISGGSRSYVQRLLRDVAEVRLGCGVRGVRRDACRVTLHLDGGEAHYDQVVIAAHADQALAMLEDPDAGERALLGAFRYCRNEAVLHRDRRLMPRGRGWWSSWNYMGAAPGQGPCLTYWMNRLQRLNTNGPLFVSLNPQVDGDLAGEVRRDVYHHPIFDAAAMAAQRRLWSLQGTRRTWFCGAHFGSGFHEDGLQAGLAVAEQLGGVRRPWRVEDDSGRIFLGPAGRPEPASLHEAAA